MNIVKLTTTNFKKARNAVIEPDQDGNLVIIAGNNGQGKSSILDSIQAALSGANSKTTPKPIHDGADRAEIVLETQDLIVTRVFSASGSRLTVTDKSGAKFAQAQTKLNELVGKLTMDPLAFTLMDEKKQLQQLLDLVELPFNPTELENERQKVFEERTAVNRKVKEFEAALARFGDIPEGLPANEVSVAELLGEYREAEALARQQQKDRDDLAESTARAQAALAEIKRLQTILEEHNQNIEAAEAAIRNHAPLPDLTTIQARIDGAEETNRHVRRAKERGALQFQYEATKSESQALTEQLDKINQTKSDGLAKAKFPVDGLGFDEDGITFQPEPGKNPIPFKQASTAEQIRVSMAMAMALNPEMRVIRISDASLLDSDSLVMIEQAAQEHDFQVWLEMVGDEFEDAFTIVDGEVQ